MMKRSLICAGVALCLALGTATIASAQTSSPGSPGSGVTDPTIVPPGLLLAKPMPVPTVTDHVVVRADANRTAIDVSVGTIIEFQLNDVPNPGWICDGKPIRGTSVELAGGVYKAVAPGISQVVFSCHAPAPKPGFATSNVVVPMVFQFDVH